MDRFAFYIARNDKGTESLVLNSANVLDFWTQHSSRVEKKV